VSRRRPEPIPARFVHGRTVPAETVRRIEGAAEAGRLAIKPLLVGEGMLLIELHREKGLVDPLHSHPDHESICYLLSGRLRVEIDGESFVAEPGDAWIHAPGVPHRHEALEDSVQIEIKAPPRRTWE
jgi:quercetin dioxygenase-like cupin family protein